LLGDTSRAIGDVALQVRAKAKDLDRKHNVKQVVQEQSTKLAETAQQYSNKEGVARARDIAVKGAQDTHEYVKKNQIIERTVQGTCDAVYWAAEKIMEQKARREQRAGSASPTKRVQ
jgi:hypothetical protein